MIGVGSKPSVIHVGVNNMKHSNLVLRNADLLHDSSKILLDLLKHGANPDRILSVFNAMICDMEKIGNRRLVHRSHSVVKK